MKSNNIKNHSISNAKNQQFKTALKSLETVNTILKDKQLDLLSEKIELMQLGLTDANTTNKSNEDNVEPVNNETLEKLNKLNEELAELKAK